MTTRRRFLAAASAASALPAVSATAPSQANPVLTIGLMADCQYADIDPAGSRFYRESPGKLEEAVAAFNKQHVAFSCHLGDLIDRDFESFDDLDPIAKRLEAPLHHVLGNHDFDVADELKAKVPPRMGLEKSYYSFRKKGFRFVMIDTTEVSPYRYPASDPRTEAARKEVAELREEGLVYAQPWNGRPTDRQLAWLRKELNEAEKAGENVLIFGHHPILPQEGHAMWNTKSVAQLLEPFPCVKAYLNGHNHAGAYHNENGLHFLTLDGMVETEDKNAYGIGELYPDRLVITGSGRQESRVLKFR